MLNQNWQKPNRCDNSGPNCVEARIDGGVVEVRNSQKPSALASFTTDEWAAFVGGVKDGQYDLA